MKIKLTQSIISSGLHCPPDRRGIEYVDAAQPGLYILCRRDSDIQSYFLRYTNRLGKTAHLLLGRVAEMTLKEARYRAKEERAKIREGADPRADIKAINDRPTLTEFYFSTYLPRIKLRNRSWKSADLIFKKRLQPKWGDRRLDTITKAEAESYLSELLSEGNAPATADHVIKTLRNILSVAVSYEIIDRNRLSGVALILQDNKVQRLLTEDELQRLIRVLNEDETVASDVAMLALLTGARMGELLNAQWEQIDRESNVWRIPASISKSKRSRTVPLSEVAMELLESLGTEGMSEWLFVSSRKRAGKLARLTTVQKAWRMRLRVAAGLDDLRFHDLRHQYASMLVNNNVPIYQVSKLLGHHSVTQTERYSHLGSGAMQEASAVVGSIISAAMDSEAA